MGGSGHHLVQPPAAKLEGLWWFKKFLIFKASAFALFCRTQTYDSYKERYISAAQQEWKGGETLGSDAGEPSSREVTSRWAGVEEERLRALPESLGAIHVSLLQLGMRLRRKRLIWYVALSA